MHTHQMMQSRVLDPPQLRAWVSTAARCLVHAAAARCLVHAAVYATRTRRCTCSVSSSLLPLSLMAMLYHISLNSKQTHSTTAR